MKNNLFSGGIEIGNNDTNAAIVMVAMQEQPDSDESEWVSVFTRVDMGHALSVEEKLIRIISTLPFLCGSDVVSADLLALSVQESNNERRRNWVESQCDYFNRQYMGHSLVRLFFTGWLWLEEAVTLHASERLRSTDPSVALCKCMIVCREYVESMMDVVIRVLNSITGTEGRRRPRAVVYGDCIRCEFVRKICDDIDAWKVITEGMSHRIIQDEMNAPDLVDMLIMIFCMEVLYQCDELL